MKKKSDELLRQDAEYFDALMAEMDEDTRAAYQEWVDEICKIMHHRTLSPFGAMSAKHLIIRVADYLNCVNHPALSQPNRRR